MQIRSNKHFESKYPNKNLLSFTDFTHQIHSTDVYGVMYKVYVYNRQFHWNTTLEHISWKIFYWKCGHLESPSVLYGTTSKQSKNINNNISNGTFFYSFNKFAMSNILVFKGTVAVTFDDFFQHFCSVYLLQFLVLLPKACWNAQYLACQHSLYMYSQHCYCSQLNVSPD